MPDELTAQADIGLVGVDVANACRDHRLPGPVGLARLDLVLDAWREQVSRHTEFHLVADRSLLDDLSRGERRTLKTMRRAGELLICRKADGPLLDHAEAQGGCVLSRDRFLDERRERRWLPERFFTWFANEEGVRIARKPSANTQPFDISRKVQQKLGQSGGFADLRHPALRKRWACVSDVPCMTRQLTPDALRVLPVLQGSHPICPGCHRPLRDLGPRPSEAELKLCLEDTTLARFTITQGQTIAFGRRTLPDTVELAELAQKGAFAGMGRAHADLRMSGKRVAVRPIDNRHRVEVRPWDPEKRCFRRERELQPADGFAAIGLRDTLIIGDRLELIRSGRSISEAEELLESSDESPWRFRSTVAPQKKPPARSSQGAEG